MGVLGGYRMSVGPKLGKGEAWVRRYGEGLEQAL